MKCQKCAKPATFHITDIERGKPREYHFCDEHARLHLTPTEEIQEPPPMGDLAKKLIPLLENIHDETRHSGKVPKRAPKNSQQQTILIQLRNELKRSIAAEDYETAARVRDKIRTLEQEQGR